MRKPNYYYRQSGVIPYRIEDGRIEFLFITSKKKKKWIIPKGIIENDLNAPESAAKEAEEEAGILGKVLENSIGSYETKKWDGICTIEVYPMRVTKILKVWEEMNFRTRKWFDFYEAKNNIHNKKLIKLIKKTLKVIEDEQN